MTESEGLMTNSRALMTEFERCHGNEGSHDGVWKALMAESEGLMTELKGSHDGIWEAPRKLEGSHDGIRRLWNLGGSHDGTQGLS